MFDSRPRERAISAFCEASSRCTPTDRPTRPIWLKMFTNSGLASSSSVYSSIRTSSAGIGSRSGQCPDSRAFSYSVRPMMLNDGYFAAALSKSCWRRLSSPVMTSIIRSTMLSDFSRLVTTAATCGMSSMPW